MNDLFWLCLLFPVIWPFIAKLILAKEINWWETGLGLLITIGLVTMVWSAGAWIKPKDVEILNGEVTGEHVESVHCSHSYDCNCHTSWHRRRKGRSYSSQICSTCYAHDHDQNWVIETTLGNFNIDRVDPQGLRQPQRYSAVKKGDPVAVPHSYDNWVTGASSSLIAGDDPILARYQGKLPAYPGQIYDYYRIDRLVADGVDVPDIRGWDWSIGVLLRTLGPITQANLIIVITKDPSPDYATALAAYWKGGKNNDVVAVIGAPEYPKIAWARSFSWSKSANLGIDLRNHLEALGTVTRDHVLGVLSTDIPRDYQIRPMSDFAYLKDEVEPPLWVIITCFFIAIPGTLILSWIFYKVDFDPRRWR